MNLTDRNLWNSLLINPAPINQFCDPKNIVYNDIVFHTAHVLISLSFLAPFSLCGLLYLRGLITVGYLVFTIWSYINLCSLDILFWYILFTITNSICFLISIYQIHPFINFPREVELAYR